MQKRRGGDLRQSVRIPWSGEDSTRCEVVLEKAVEAGVMMVRERPKGQMEKIRHDFLGEDRPEFPFLPPSVNHWIEAVR